MRSVDKSDLIRFRPRYDNGMDECRAIHVRRLGRTRYGDALSLQRELHARRKAGDIGDTLLLTEHEPVFTLGRNAAPTHLLVPEADVAARGIDLLRVERGGEITYHGPGQLVAYPILDLAAYGRDVRGYIHRLEETALRLLAGYGVAGERRAGAPGLWTGGRKIASTGVYISRWVTMHGIAINLDMDLTPFVLINPCGFAGMEMTSVARETGQAVSMPDAFARYTQVAGEVFGAHVTAE